MKKTKITATGLDNVKKKKGLRYLHSKQRTHVVHGRSTKPLKAGYC